MTTCHRLACLLELRMPYHSVAFLEGLTPAIFFSSVASSIPYGWLLVQVSSLGVTALLLFSNFDLFAG